MKTTLAAAWAKRAKLRDDGDKLRAEGDKLWAEAIIEIKGNIKIEWQLVSDKSTYRCKLETGEVFEP